MVLRDDVAGFGPGNGTGVSSNTGNSMPANIYNVSGDPHLSDPKFATSNSDPNFYFNTAAFTTAGGGNVHHATESQPAVQSRLPELDRFAVQDFRDR